MRRENLTVRLKAGCHRRNVGVGPEFRKREGFSWKIALLQEVQLPLI
jgi:hypothetical protein